MSEYQVIHYRENGRKIYQDWVDNLRDYQAQTTIQRRIKRIIDNGYFGEHRPCREGVWELIIDTGPGYRVYYSQVGKTIILLLCGGDKRTQQRDINKAIEYLRKWKGDNK